MSFVDKLKKRWAIEKNIDLVLILLVFTLAGSSSVFIRRPLFALLGVTTESAFWIKAVFWLIIFFPSYQLLLLLWGFLLGQWKFFWAFEKKMLKRFRIIKD